MQARSPLEMPPRISGESSQNGEEGMFLGYCYICQTVTSEPLVKNPTNHRKVLGFISERAAFGDSLYSKILEKINGIKIKTLMSCAASFHGSCYRKTVHAGNYKRIKEQYYKIHPRKRPPRKPQVNHLKNLLPDIKCSFCDSRRNNKNNTIQKSIISPAGILQLKTAVSSGLCSKLVIEKLHLLSLDANCSIGVTYHELCWKKHVSKIIGEVDKKSVKPEDTVDEEFIQYLKEKFALSKSISLALLLRAYQNIQGKHKVAPQRDRKAFKQLIKCNMNQVVIRRKHKTSTEMVSLSSCEMPQPAVDTSPGAEDEERPPQYALRPRSVSASSGPVSASCGLVNSFPDEILLRIFSSLTTEELGRSVLAVCRRWWQIGRDPSLWIHLHLKRDEVSRRKSVLATLHHSPLLRTLTIAENSLPDAPAMDDIISSVANNCPLLMELTAPHRPVVDSAVILQLETKCPLIEHINLQNFITKETVVDPLFLLPLMKLPKLRSLLVGHRRFFQGDTIVREIAERCRNVVKLDIRGFLIHDDTYRHLLSKMKRNLLSLAFSPSIWNKAFRFIIECSPLEELRLRIGYHATTCEQQLSCIRALKNLKVLKIQFVDLDHNTELSQLFREPTFANLEKIEITGYHDDVCDDFLNLVGFTMPCLKELTLRSLVLVTDVGLGKLMIRCHSLTSLRLVEMDSLTGSHLEKHARNLPHLENIEVIRCPRISSLVINQLRMKKKLKNVHIIWVPC